LADKTARDVEKARIEAQKELRRTKALEREKAEVLQRISKESDAKEAAMENPRTRHSFGSAMFCYACGKIAFRVCSPACGAPFCSKKCQLRVGHDHESQADVEPCTVYISHAEERPDIFAENPKM
jgi:hypothetical protein